MHSPSRFVDGPQTAPSAGPGGASHAQGSVSRPGLEFPLLSR